MDKNKTKLDGTLLVVSKIYHYIIAGKHFAVWISTNITETNTIQSVKKQVAKNLNAKTFQNSSNEHKKLLHNVLFFLNYNNFLTY